MNVYPRVMLRRTTRVLLSLGEPRLLASIALTGGAAAPFRLLASITPKGASAAAHFPTSQFLAMLQAKDAELRELHVAKEAELKAKEEELKAERAAKEAERAAKEAELKSERAAKDAELGELRKELREEVQAHNSERLIAQRDATALAAALHAVDTARRIIGVRASLEVCIGELWEKYGNGNKTRLPTDRLRMLAKGLCPPLVEYVRGAALANGLDPRKALEELPQLYHALSAPLHQAGIDSDVETPIDAILNGDTTALLLTSCLFKMTRRELRLYRIHSGERVPVQLILVEPPVPPPA